MVRKGVICEVEDSFGGKGGEGGERGVGVGQLNA